MATEWLEFMRREGFDRLVEARKLSEDESKNDPEDDPFRSKYKAREIISDLKKQVTDRVESHPENLSLKFFKAAFHLKLGSNYIDTEELSEGQDEITKCIEMLEEYKLHPEAASIYTNALNNLGLLWTGRQKLDAALGHLQQAERLYTRYREEVGGAPKAYREYFTREEEGEEEKRVHRRMSYFESVYTYTLYYMAQVYAKLGEREKAAICCHTTLQRQLDAHEYDPLDWSLNAATLSQYYITVDDFTQARHCLASAEVIFQEAESQECESETDEKKERRQQSKADIERCWAKYGLALLETSRDKLYEEGDRAFPQQNSQDDEKKDFQRFNVEVTSHEEQVTDKYLLDFTDARGVFIKVQQWLNSAKTFYSINDRCTDYVEITQDHSKAFKFLAFYETDMERQCKMQKRRIDMLLEVCNELNPQYYLLIQRQLLFELAETYSLMMDLKFTIIEEEGGNPSIHAVKKVNSLVHQSLVKYQEFLNSFKDGKPELPEKFPESDVRPVLVAKFCMGRLHSKLIVPNVQEKIKCVKRTEECYEFVCDYCSRYPEAAELIPEELNVCREMVALLPVKLEKLRQDANV